jgi:hypothetical protein
MLPPARVVLMCSGLFVVAAALATWLRVRQRPVDIGPRHDVAGIDADVADVDAGAVVSLPDYPLSGPGPAPALSDSSPSEPGSFVVPRRPPGGW